MKYRLCQRDTKSAGAVTSLFMTWRGSLTGGRPAAGGNISSCGPCGPSPAYHRAIQRCGAGPAGPPVRGPHKSHHQLVRKKSERRHNIHHGELVTRANKGGSMALSVTGRQEILHRELKPLITSGCQHKFHFLILKLCLSKCNVYFFFFIQAEAKSPTKKLSQAAC